MRAASGTSSTGRVLAIATSEVPLCMRIRYRPPFAVTATVGVADEVDETPMSAVPELSQVVPVLSSMSIFCAELLISTIEQMRPWTVARRKNGDGIEARE
jgi:hypothetical protein